MSYDLASPQTGRFSPLFTDLYQLTMARAYLEAGTAHDIATFELFFRNCPFRGEYAVASGYHQVRDVLENFRFSEDDLSYLRSLPSFRNAAPTFFETLQALQLNDVEVHGVREGSLVFPRVPILQVTGPIFKIQILESALLNAINFSTLVSTYARRIKLVAKDNRLLEFGMRRAQGPNGAMTASRASFLGGFDATTNILAAKIFDIPVVGTMAHSFVQSFSSLSTADMDWLGETPSLQSEATNQGELAAFISYAKVFPNECALLVDTYDVLKSGIPNAIRVFEALQKRGHKPVGLRLDSGDLVFFSKEARRLLDGAGLTDVKILASNELDENIIESLQDQGARIDSYGVGTQLVTAAPQPALGGVYKLVEVNGKARMKISEQTEKLVLPCRKNVFRLYGRDEKMLLDLMTLHHEPAPQPAQELLALHPADPFKKATVSPSRIEPLLTPLFKKGKWLDELSLREKRERSLKEMTFLRDDISRRHNPTPYKVSVTEKLKTLMNELYQRERPTPRLD